MLVDSMSRDKITNEVNYDVCDVTHHVLLEGLKKGKFNSLRIRERKKLKPLQRKDLYKISRYQHTTSNHNKWSCLIHIFNKCELWQGFTTVAGSKNIRTIFYESGKAYFIDRHFFQRYRERYLNRYSIETSSGLDYFSKSNDIFMILPVFLGELELNQVSVLLKHGIGLGDNINHTGVCTDYHPRLQLETNYYQVNTFIGFEDLKKSQIEDIITHLMVKLEDFKNDTIRDKNAIFRAQRRLELRHINTVMPIILDCYKTYFKK